MSHTNIVLSVTGLSAAYGSRYALKGVNLRTRERESIALIGPNGCGKSTFLRTVAGLVDRHHGEAHLDEMPLAGASVSSRARRGLGYLKQTQNLFTNLSVRGNLELAGKATADTAQFEQRLERILKSFGTLANLLERRAGLLSGGQRQSLATAMVLMRPVRLLMLDEPVAGLSPPMANELLLAVRKAQGAEGFSLIIVEHRLRLIHPHVDRVLVMREGEIVDDTEDTGRMLDAGWVAGHFRAQPL